MASDISTTDTTTSTTDTTTAVISGFSSVVATLMASHKAGTAGEASSTPKPAPWRVLGKVKIIYNAINALDISPTLELMELRADLAEVANFYLPQDTAEVLASTNGSSDLALEIVARDLTQLTVLAKRLYQVRVGDGEWYMARFVLENQAANFAQKSAACGLQQVSPGANSLCIERAKQTIYQTLVCLAPSFLSTRFSGYRGRAQVRRGAQFSSWAALWVTFGGVNSSKILPVIGLHGFRRIFSGCGCIRS